MTDEPRSNFLTDIIDADLASGRHSSVVTRFPPEPNGYPHVGHAKSICLNYGLAQRYEGQFNLRFDDTNPAAEKEEYVRAITHDVQWLLDLDKIEPVFWASDYFERIYGFAVELVEKGLAYVDSQTGEQVRENRGDFTTPGTNSPFRDRSVAENLDMLTRMRAGEFEDGSHTLRAKIDMAHPNMVMRDPLLYRIKRATHHNTGDEWCIYPMYDFAHCLEDAIEHITHSICTLEFENNREIYNWLIENTSVPSRPRQYEFARLNLDYTIMSKRKLRQLVDDRHVDGWDDPRMPTISGMRRRGIRAAAIRQFCDMIGVAKTNSSVDMAKLEFAIRDDLNHVAPRAIAVVEPLVVTLTNVEDDFSEEIAAPLWPEGFDNTESRPLTLRKRVLIDRSDFAAEPLDGWKRLSPGASVRLRYARPIRCDEVVRDADGNVVELRCTLLADGDDEAVSGIIHWLSESDAKPATLLLYDRLFAHPAPLADPDVDFLTHLNPDSLRGVDTARVEPWVFEQNAATDAQRRSAGEPVFHVQFERVGYFCSDKNSAADAPVFNRVVTLKDSWAKATGAGVDIDELREEKDRARAEQAARSAAAARTPAQVATERGPDVRARFETLTARGVPPKAALPIASDAEHTAFVLATESFGPHPTETARYFANYAAPHWSDAAPYPAGTFSRFVADLANSVISGSDAKKLHKAMLAGSGYDPSSLAKAETGVVDAAIDAVLEAEADSVARYRDGKTQLLGFFIGKVMAATRGAADAGEVRKALLARLG